MHHSTQVQPPHPESAAAYESQLRMRRESRGALSVGESETMAATSVGEQVEVDPLRHMSVYEIYDHIRRNFEKKDESARATALAEMQAQLGVEVDTALPASTVDDSPDRAATASTPEQKLMHQLAEDIYDALERVQQTIAIIKPESIGSKITAHLDHPGDANFLVAAGEGEQLYESLRAQDADFRVVRTNSYGFVLENKELGFRALFIFQDRITPEGKLITPNTTAEEQRDEGTYTAANASTTATPNLTEN